MNTIGAKKIIDKKTGAFVTGEYEYRGYRISNLDGVWTVRKQTESGDPADKVEFTAQYKALAIDGIDKILRAKNARYYIAYGSNMNVEQMRHRCPRAVVVGTSTVKDYELLFRGGKHGAVATIEPREGESVPVVIWSIAPTDERSLDIYEGYPRLYEKENFVVELNGEEITAMAYIMTPGRTQGAPAPYYLQTIECGYDKFDIPKKGLFDAALAVKRAEQEAGNFAVCPRCGGKSMREKLTYNCTSRRADVYVCEKCGMDEALHDHARKKDSVLDWSMFS